MKHTIEGFSQIEAIKLQTENQKIDVIDLVILRWLTDFNPEMSKRVIDDEEYFWVNYQYVLEQMPILSIEKRSLYRRLQKLCDLKILKHKNIKKNGNYSYYGFGENYSNLIMTKMSQPCVTDDITLVSKMSEQRLVYQKDSYITPIIPLKGNTEGSKHPKEIYEDIIGYMNERVCNEDCFTNKIIYHYKPTNKSTQKLINARLEEGYSIDDFKDVIFYCYREWVDKPKQFKNGQMSNFYYRPATMFSATNFESYLNDYKATL